MRKRILYVLDFLSYGGVERITFDFLRNVQSTEFEFYTLALTGGLFEREFKENISRFTQFPRQRFKLFFDIIRLRRFVKKNAIHLIHSHNIRGALICWLATLGIDVKLIRSFHHYGTIDRIHNYINCFLIQRFDSNFFVSDSFRKEFAQRLRLKEVKNSTVIYNGIDFKRFRLNGTTIHDELKISRETPVIGMVGNFVSMKDQLTVCKALKIVHDNGIDFQFIFAGSHNGIEKHFLYNCVDFCKENGLDDQVHFLGFRSDVPVLVNTMELFVFSSIGDTFGLALVEALGSGVPVISSNIKPSLEITNNGEFISLFQTGNEYQLAERIQEYFHHPDDFKSRASRAKQFVTDRYTIDKHIEDTIKQYKRVLA